MLCQRTAIFIIHGVSAYVELSKSVTYNVLFQLGCSRQLTASLGFGTEFVSPVERGKRLNVIVHVILHCMTVNKHKQKKYMVLTVDCDSHGLSVR